jgi:Zn-dependent peptidase ImmA (M78 family)
MKVNLIALRSEATKFRINNEIGIIEPINFSNLLSQLKVLTVFKPLKGDISGLSLKIDDSKFILINSECTLGRQYYTICHELYHLFIQKDFKTMLCQTGLFNNKNVIEYSADWFAAFLMLPEEGILRLIPPDEVKKNKITLPTILNIEQHFSCSRKALLRRLDNIGLIEYEKYEHLNENVKFSATQYGYNTALYSKGNENLIIGNYGQLARKLLDNGLITETNYLELMRDIGFDMEKNYKIANE